MDGYHSLDLCLGSQIESSHTTQHRRRQVPLEPSLTLSISDSSSFSNIKIEKDDEVEVNERSVVPSRSNNDEEDGNAKKKLRLTKEQSALLEERFKEHSTLNPKQKQALAKQLNLRPRQVEVWFQNRRARTKLKKTETDCEYLKRCYESLSEENRRLHKEINELRSIKVSPQPPLTTLTMCPSCSERVANAGNKGKSGPFAKPHFFNPFPHSTTC